MEKIYRCPNCGRNLTEDEMYCYVCEMDLTKLLKKTKKQSKDKHKN